jgi:myosin heavy subunit
MYSLILIFTLIIISGLIAFVGDWVGLKIGKKRVTIFGLRPHYTAIFITITSGILIAVITITILAISSNDVRTALFGMEELKEKLSNLSREVELGNMQLSSTKEDLKEKTTQLQEMEEKYQKLSEDIKNKTSQLEELSKIREGLIEEKDKLDKEVEELNATIKALYSGIAWVREGEVIFGSDEQIALTIIQGQRPIEEIKKELIRFLNEASNKVLAMGAKKDERTNQVFIISQEEFEDITQKICDSDKEMIVRLLLFKLDEEIISEEIESLKDSGEVENKLLSLLRKVNIIAVKEGIIPDPKTSFVGAVSAINLYDTVKTIVESGTAMKVTVISIYDTWRTGPLKVRMEAKPIS